ncbi:hypothetical protein PK35_14375 [Tamlana nanhaiensis]|uniref:Uncharacterized protein n=1 Tax=Neotamlana nanhaiensis TaxID=1382798 RepID=A0A0D7VXH3_9FLAO|nr:hypothetical protein [Tamlana nanhaiensis]KJD31585.1 hypothetical protein PK35_14375 [Tamlana nanhaiensis]
MDKTRSILKKILSNFLLGLLFMGIVLLSVGLGYRGKYQRVSDSYLPMAFIGFGILLPYIIYFFYSSYKYQKRQKILLEKESNNFNIFINNSRKSDLNLNDVEIISFNSKSPGFYESKVGQLNQKDSYKNKKPNEVKVEFPFGGQKLNYLFKTNKGLDNIKIHFAIKKVTKIYFDKNDSDKIYIDFDFLNK